MTIWQFLLMVICLGVFGLGLLAYAIYLTYRDTINKGGKHDYFKR